MQRGEESPHACPHVLKVSSFAQTKLAPAMQATYVQLYLAGIFESNRGINQTQHTSPYPK